jgi:hypothetical protein
VKYKSIGLDWIRIEKKIGSYSTQTKLSFPPILKSIGLGIITGAADNDPSSITAYSQSGAKFGFGLLWLVNISISVHYSNGQHLRKNWHSNRKWLNINYIKKIFKKSCIEICYLFNDLKGTHHAKVLMEHYMTVIDRFSHKIFKWNPNNYFTVTWNQHSIL